MKTPVRDTALIYLFICALVSVCALGRYAIAQPITTLKTNSTAAKTPDEKLKGHGAATTIAPTRPWRYAPRTKEVEITGEVVDSWCYASQVMGPGRGEHHKACGLACAHGGVTIGIVDDQGRLYIAAKHEAYTGCKELLTPYMAKRVKVAGWLADKGGCNVLKIKSVQEVK